MTPPSQGTAPWSTWARLNRRQVLLVVSGSAALLAARQWLPSSIAQPASTEGKQAVTAASADVVAFLNFSRKLTGHPELSDVTARRMLEAAKGVQAPFSEHVPALVQLTSDATDSRSLMAAAELAGLADHARTINAAWYTGTVVGPSTSLVVAYLDALMYAPVKDGLPVPTYCFNGPLWWTQAPPAA